MPNLLFAKWKLNGVFSPGKTIPVSDIYRALQDYKIPRRLLKQARREMGILSENVGGRQCWRMP